MNPDITHDTMQGPSPTVRSPIVHLFSLPPPGVVHPPKLKTPAPIKGRGENTLRLLRPIWWRHRLSLS